jgi:GAF domain-containing protein
MAKGIRLRKLVRRDEAAAVLAAVSGGEDAVVDAKGRLLAGPRLSGPSVEVTGPDGTPLGSVTGPRAEETADALTALVGLEQERRELADEVLDMYREVNLLYALGEVLATATDRADLAARALREATRQVAVDAAYLVVDVTGPKVTAAVGDAEPAARIPADLETLRIDTDGDGALLVAPLAFRGTQRGAIVLCRRSGTFEAGDLKLTGAVAAQCAGVLERILEEESRARAAADREAALRRQLDQLRIELDAQRQAERVGEVTDTEYFGGLRAQASDLRRIIGDGPR